MSALYISEALNVSRALVFSVDNPAPIPAPELTFGDSFVTSLYLVDGQGGYSTVSGEDGSTVKVGIGDLDSDDPVWLNTTWARITNGWSGIIAANTAEVKALFDGRNVITASLRIVIIDAAGSIRARALLPFKLWRIGIPTTATATSPEGAQSGQFDIPNGVDAVTVTGLALTGIPRAVIPFIIKPAGGSNLFPSLIDGTITTDGFQVDFGAQTDSGNYKLGYFLIF